MMTSPSTKKFCHSGGVKKPQIKLRTSYRDSGGARSLLLDFGTQPVTNRFVSDRFAAKPEENEKRYPLALSQCELTGTIFLADPFPIEEIFPRFSWITYNEPEAHLDDLVEKLSAAGIAKSGCVGGGISFKDDSTLDRLRKRGLQTWRLDPATDLGIALEGAGVESIQHALSAGGAEGAPLKYGRSDILVVRHILEHVYDMRGFTAALKALVNPGGFIVFEIPDCSGALDLFDYTMVWEEHTIYFTPSTLKTVLRAAGFDIAQFVIYPSRVENSLVAVVQVSSRGFEDSAENPEAAAEIARGREYARFFPGIRQRIRDFFAKSAGQSGKLLIFGAGHAACTFINIFDLAEFFSGAIDDNPHKQGLFLPGSRLPIMPSSVLNERDVELCLLSVSPAGEDKVVEKNSTSCCGSFLSIFPGSPRSLYKAIGL